MRRFAIFLVLLGAQLGMLSRNLPAQSAPTPAAELTDRIRTTVAHEFGANLTLVARFQPMLGDFDGDGAEDLAVVVTGRPAIDQAAHDYKLIDPYDAYFGYGDAKLMLSFPTHAVDEPLYVAIIHDWRAAHPKAKFVIVNLPFEHIELSRLQRKKKKKRAIAALFATDATGLQAEIYWDGRKYRWEAIGSE